MRTRILTGHLPRIKARINATDTTRMATNNVYKDMMKEAFHAATPEIVAGYKKKMGFIRERYSHTTKTVESCLQGMSEKPTLVELLVGAFLVNGGVLFKYKEEEDEEGHQGASAGDFEFSRLIKEMDELNCAPIEKENSFDDIFAAEEIHIVKPSSPASALQEGTGPGTHHGSDLPKNAALPLG